MSPRVCGRTVRFVRTGLLAGAAVGWLGATGAAPATTARAPALTAAGSAYLVLTADSLDAAGLTYGGVVTGSGPSGDVQALRFTMSSGSLVDLSMTTPCAAGAAVTTTAGTATLGSTRFDAVSLAVTVNGVAVSYTVASPPTTAFPGEVTLQAVTLSATTMSADTLSAASLAVRTLAC